MSIARHTLSGPDFIQVHPAVIASVGANAAIVLSRINFRMNVYGEPGSDGVLWYTSPLDLIARDTGLSIKQVRTAVTALVAAGHLAKVKRRQGGIGSHVLSYRIVFNDEAVPSRAPHESIDPAHAQIVEIPVMPSRADRVPDRETDMPSGANLDMPSGANLPSIEEEKKSSSTPDHAREDETDEQGQGSPVPPPSERLAWYPGAKVIETIKRDYPDVSVGRLHDLTQAFIEKNSASRNLSDHLWWTFASIALSKEHSS